MVNDQNELTLINFYIYIDCTIKIQPDYRGGRGPRVKKGDDPTSSVDASI